MAASSQKIVIALSGGVDSSVAAALLVDQGYDVIGIMLRLWSEPGREDENRCCTPDAMALARRVASRLKIPFYVLDAKDIFLQQVVQPFLNGYANSLTPNPCIFCNRLIRWDFLLNHSLAIGASTLATGHYVRLSADTNGNIQLRRGIDMSKDQSYVLYMLSQEKLSHALFPLGEYTKPQVRELARQYKLPVAERPESQDLCFLGGTDYRDFLTRYQPDAARPGPIVNNRGETIGRHSGLAFYTIGQRKKLQVSSPVPLYVLKFLREQNALVVGTREELGQDKLTAKDVNWISGQVPSKSFMAQVKIRYKSKEELGLVVPLPDGKFDIKFDRPLRDITPGQAAVLYDGDICLGGGEIEPCA